MQAAPDMPAAPGDTAPALLHGLLGVGCGRISESTLCTPVTPPPDWQRLHTREEEDGETERGG